LNKIEFVNAVIELHNIAQLVEQNFGEGNLSADLRNCADRLHVAALGVRIAESETINIINKAKI
jgi:hypothetical protein